jgi:hypothetical protein
LLDEIFHLGLPGGTASLAVIALLITLVLSWKVRTISVSSIELTMTLSLLLCLTAVTLLPSQGFQDQVVLMPGILLVLYRWREFSSTRTLRALLATGFAVLVWPWVAALGLIALRPLLTDQQFYSKAVFALPLRTAAVFPFVLLAVLALGLRSRCVTDSDLPPCIQ